MQEVNSNKFPQFIPLVLVTLLANVSISYAQWDYKIDLAADSVTYPAYNQAIPERTSFEPAGYFENVGTIDEYDIPAAVEIRRCTDGLLVFRDTTDIFALYDSSAAIPVTFPSAYGIYDVRKLLPGCYTIAVISYFPLDGYPYNDTAFSTFTITPRTLTNDVAVDSIMAPTAGERLLQSAMVPIKIRFKNTGSFEQQSVVTSTKIFDGFGKLVYNDSSTLTNWMPDETRDITFPEFTPSGPGSYQIFGFAYLAADQYPLDDSLSTYLYVGIPNDVATIRISNPPSGATEVAGTGFQTTASFEWVGSNNEDSDIIVHCRIQSCSDSRVVFDDYEIIQALWLDSGAKSFSFPSKNAQFNTAPLEPGCYTIMVNSEERGDSDRANDSASITFTVKYAHDLAVDSVVAPQDSSDASGSSIPIILAVTNLGASTEPTVIVHTIVKDTSGAAVYSNTDWGYGWTSGMSQQFTFPDFVPTARGLYTIYGATELNADDDHASDTAVARVFFGEPYIDVSAIAVDVPRMDQILGKGSAFNPVGRIRWTGGFADTFQIPVRMLIRDFTSDSIEFEADTTLTGVKFGHGDYTVVFPSTSMNYGTNKLPLGHYRTAVFANLSSDEEHSNDTAWSSFYIEMNSVSGGKTNSSDEPILEQNYPNPFENFTTISYQLPQPGIVTLRVFDVTGKCVRTIVESNVESSGRHSQLLNAESIPSGSYLCVLQLNGASGGSHIVTKPMSLVR